MALEQGIAQLVQGFIAEGRPSSRRQSIEVRRAGYIASTGLAGETETRVQVETLVLEVLPFGYFHLSMRLNYCLLPSTTTADALSAAALIPMTTSSVS